MPLFRVASLGLNVRHTPSSATDDNLFPPPLMMGDVVERVDVSGDGKWFLVRLEQDGILREGWVAANRLVPADEPLEMRAGDPPWIVIAKREMGVTEKEPDNQRVLEYLATTTNLSHEQMQQDETDWCSAFVNWCMTQAGYVGTNHALARSWWNQWAGGTHHADPRFGCIAVFRRLENGIDRGKGHVGFFMGIEGNNVLVLGGNQDDGVNIRPRPCDDLIGYVYPNPLPATAAPENELDSQAVSGEDTSFFTWLPSGRMAETGLDERRERIARLEALLTDGEAESPSERVEIERQIDAAQREYVQADARARYSAPMPIPHPSNAGPNANWKAAWGWTTPDFKGRYIVDPNAPFNDSVVRNKPGEAQGSNIERVVAFLDVENTARYVPQGASTFCTVFVYDATWLLSAEIPIAPNRAANSMCSWLEGTEAQARGWRRLASVEEAQQLANEGCPVVATQRRTNAGHVALVRPVPLDNVRLQHDAYTAQAGAINKSLTRVSDIFGDPDNVIFYAHA